MKTSEMVHHVECADGSSFSCIGFNPFAPLTTDDIMDDEQCWGAIKETIERHDAVEITSMDHQFGWGYEGCSSVAGIKWDKLKKVWMYKRVASFTLGFEDGTTMLFEKASHLIPITEAAMQREERRINDRKGGRHQTSLSAPPVDCCVCAECGCDLLEQPLIPRYQDGAVIDVVCLECNRGSGGITNV